MYYLISLLIIAIDQFTKLLVLNYMDLYQSIPIWQDVLHITSTRNRGAAFSILQDQRLFFLITTAIVVIGIIYYMEKHKKDKFLNISLALILGGAIGNFIDRVRLNEVVDFIDFTLINFPVFNFADTFIDIGVGLLLLTIFLNEKREKSIVRESNGK